MKDFGNHRARFTPELWAKWLARLNTAPSLELRDGIADFRSLLASRCLGRIREQVDDTGAYRTFVARHFGVAK